MKSQWENQRGVEKEESAAITGPDGKERADEQNLAATDGKYRMNQHHRDIITAVGKLAESPWLRVPALQLCKGPAGKNILVEMDSLKEAPDLMPEMSRPWMS